MKHIWLILLFIACNACGGSRRLPAEVHEGPYFRSGWRDTSALSSTTPTPNSHSGKQTDIRLALVSAAQKLLNNKKTDADLGASDFGANDVIQVFRTAGFLNCWKDGDDVPDFVKAATHAKAYRTTDPPRQGDLILFHNQFDRNRNGKSDDWFTGVGIVIETGRKTHIAVTRTAGQAREIFISPNGPMIRTDDGKTVNSFVRIPGPHDSPDAQYLSGQLYAGIIDSELVIARASRPPKHAARKSQDAH